MMMMIAVVMMITIMIMIINNAYETNVCPRDSSINHLAEKTFLVLDRIFTDFLRKL